MHRVSIYLIDFAWHGIKSTQVPVLVCVVDRAGQNADKQDNDNKKKPELDSPVHNQQPSVA